MMATQVEWRESMLARFAAVAIGAFALVAPASATATVFTGSLPASPYNQYTQIGMIDRGTYFLTVETNMPTNIEIYLYGEIGYNYICAPGGPDCGGNEVLFSQRVGYFSTPARLTTRLGWRNAYRIGSKVYHLRYGLIGFSFDPIPTGPLQYRITRQFVAQVPEPASWLQMLAGFALIGTGLRARRGLPAKAGAA